MAEAHASAIFVFGHGGGTPPPLIEPPPIMESDSNPFPGRFFLPYGDIDNVTGDLPHWRQSGVIYFVTFRLADALPEEKLKEWRHDRDQWLARHRGKLSPEDEAEYHERFSVRMESWLDAGSGTCLLRHPVCREIVENALRHFDGFRYNLGEHVVASNHVHALLNPLSGYALSSITHSWKSFTAKEIIKRIDTLGPEAGRLRHTVWQRETYDHIVRSPAALGKIIRYIRAHREWHPPQSGGGVPPPAG